MGWVALEEEISVRYMLMSLCVPVRFHTALYGGNLGMIIFCANPDLDLKKKHVEISYHELR